MYKKTALVVTSISAPNEILCCYAVECKSRGIDFIVIGDVSSPDDFYIEGCDFWPLDRQRSSEFKLAGILPEKHYARKNIGYLIAMQQGAEIIVEIDDDNIPLPLFWDEKSAFQDAHLVMNGGWTNVYGYFSKDRIWPRGYPLELVQSLEPAKELSPPEKVYCPIQQGLADGNPDVDAVYRLLFPLPVQFDEHAPIALGKQSICPFNSQNTVWFKEAFPLLYLPSNCSFRMTDIWRSFVAQRICWAFDWKILFHSPSVYQERNEHSLLKDFEDEIPGFLNNGNLLKLLSSIHLERETVDLPSALMRCYNGLIEKDLLPEKEIELLRGWLYNFE